MFLDRWELMRESRKHYDLSQRYLKESSSLTKNYTKEQREEYWAKYLEEDEKGYQLLRAVSQCPLTGKIFIPE